MSILQSAKRALRNRLWSVFVRLDDSFAANSAASRPVASQLAPLNKSQATPSTAASQFRESSTTVINDRWIITNPGALAMFLRAVFDVKALDGIHGELLDRYCGRQDFWVSTDKLTSDMRNYLLSRLDVGTGDAASIASVLLQVIEHESRTAENRQAYMTTVKPNPKAVLWPDPTSTKHPHSLFDELPFVRNHPIIDKTTPIGSAGSCFADEIAKRLMARDFNYIVTEKPGPNDVTQTCARWGTIFNTPSFRQLVEKAFGVRTTPKLLWTNTAKDPPTYADPFREEIAFESVDDFESQYKSHIEAVREALLAVRVFVITLGVNEVWRLRGDGATFSKSPWRVSPELIESKIMTVSENVNELQAMLDLWRKYNPELNIIISVSPVPLHATFRASNMHVIAANSHSKATLRVAADEFVKNNEGVYYMPSYEAVTFCTPNPWQADQRHVSQEAVDRVMELFDRLFVAPS